MFTNTTLNTLISKKQFDTAFMELSKKGIITFDTKYIDGGQKIRVVGGEYPKYNWSATFVNDHIKEIELHQSPNV